jgi:5-methylcytosine-specific restriction protein A
MEVLKPTNRSREYETYSPSLRGQIAYSFLTTKKLGHREIDKNILGLDPEYTRGFQAMNILKYQGLFKEHAGILVGASIESVIEQITSMANSSRLVGDLKAYGSENHILETVYTEEFNKKVERSLADTSELRAARLKVNENKLPRKLVVSNVVFERDPDVVAEALSKAKGVCDECLNPAPFKRKKNGRPYLEVHHVVPLSKGGHDSISNAVALCPNCHRKAHFG